MKHFRSCSQYSADKNIEFVNGRFSRHTKKLQNRQKLESALRDTALRDIQDLIEKGILIKTQDGGRSTGYELKEN